MATHDLTLIAATKMAALPEQPIAEAVIERVVELSRKVPFGELLDPATKVGAIVSPEHQAKIDGYVRGAVADGASVRLGGAALQVPGLPGQFYQPTVVAGVTGAMAIAREEVFGPVLPVLTFRSLDEAVDLANELGRYGIDEFLEVKTLQLRIGRTRAPWVSTR